jgi:hypothetical protein
MENSVDRNRVNMTETTVAPQQPLLVPQQLKLSCPYARHVLSSSTPTLRANLASTVSEQGWNDFWTAIRPVATLAETELWRIVRVQLYLMGPFFVCFIASTLITPWYVHSHDRYHQAARWTSSVVNWVVLLSLVIGFEKWQGHVRKSRLCHLQQIIQNHEETTGFQQQSGTVIECQHEYGHYYLYFIRCPHGHTTVSHHLCDNDSRGDNSGIVLQNGYLRIALSAHFYGWNPMSLSHLNGPTLLPVGFDSLQTNELWTQFWSELADCSKKYQLAFSCVSFMASGCMMLYSFQSVASFPLFVAGVEGVAVVTLLVSCLFLIYGKSLYMQPYEIVNRYQEEFEHLGFAISFHQIKEFCSLGVYDLRYLAVMPIIYPTSAPSSS